MAAKIVSFLVIFGLSIASIEARELLKKNYQNHNHHYDIVYYNVVEYGAVGDGKKDDSKAFSDAWKAACESSKNSPVMLIPHRRRYLLQPVIFKGKCRSKNITVRIEGEIVALSDPYRWECHEHKCKQWITFESVNGLSIHGFGTINGYGKSWWNLDCKHNKLKCKKKATGLVISHSKNVQIKDLNFKNSPQMHIALERSSWVYVSNITINAPWDSPNTDGIHLQHATNIYISNSTIKTGDDCISISDGSSQVNITGITCGPGHGISIGSLGEKGKEESVDFIHVKNCTIMDTTNGVRIKTWQGGRGHATNINFEDIVFENASNPIIIDQYYCPHKQCHNQTSAVKISNITYSNISGTSKTQEAVNLACSNSIPCTEILMNNINLLSISAISEDDGSSQVSENGNNTISYCLNASGYSHGTVFPSVPCLQNI